MTIDIRYPSASKSCRNINNILSTKPDLTSLTIWGWKSNSPLYIAISWSIFFRTRRLNAESTCIIGYCLPAKENSDFLLCVVWRNRFNSGGRSCGGWLEFMREYPVFGSIAESDHQQCMFYQLIDPRDYRFLRNNAQHHWHIRPRSSEAGYTSYIVM